MQRDPISRLNLLVWETQFRRPRGMFFEGRLTPFYKLRMTQIPLYCLNFFNNSRAIIIL